MCKVCAYIYVHAFMCVYLFNYYVFANIVELSLISGHEYRKEQVTIDIRMHSYRFM